MRNRSTINPYRIYTEKLLSRIKWDFNIESWSSRKKIRKWRNLYVGEKAVILCNGPSLLKSDLSLLSNSFCFGLNKINLLFDKSEFRPNCIVSVNQYVLEQNAAFFNKTKLPLFLDSIGYKNKYIKSRSNVSFLHSGVTGFAKDCSISVNQGYTVTYVALQLAFHMGFRKVALIGADHNFITKGPANLLVKAGEKDKNHFDERYFAGGVNWNLPDLLQSEISYNLAKNVFEENGGKIVNSTIGGKLEIFERMSLADFLRD